MSNSDPLAQFLMGQQGQQGQRQDPRRALAARLMQVQPPAAPITNGGAGLAYALTQGLNAFTGGWMDRDAEIQGQEREDARFRRLEDYQTRRRNEDGAAVAAINARFAPPASGAGPAGAFPAVDVPMGSPAPARPRVVDGNVPDGADAPGFTPVGFQRLTAQESGGDPNARNPRSTATGAQQFIEGTWLEFARDNPALFPAGATRGDILAMRTNPDLSERATQWYARRNAGGLQSAGQPVNDATLALAHTFGGGGARTLLAADPATPVEHLFPPAVIEANPNLRGRTAGDVVSRFGQRFGGDAPVAPASGPVPPIRPDAMPSRQQGPRIDPAMIDEMARLAGQGNAQAAALLPDLRARLARQDLADRETAATAERAAERDMQRRWREQQAEEARRARADAAEEARRNRPIPAHIQRAEDQDIEAIGAAAGINDRMRTFARMIDNARTGQGAPGERLELGPVSNATSAVRNFAGASSPNSVNYANFRAELERLRNESLRLNTGVQTDGDAQRAWNELITNINDPGVVAARLTEIQAINERAVALREAMIQSRRSGSNLPALDTSPFRRPTDAAPSAPRAEPPQAGAVMDGWRFRGGNPADRNNWERAQ